jgi:hypothetical protein
MASLRASCSDLPASCSGVRQDLSQLLFLAALLAAVLLLLLLLLLLGGVRSLTSSILCLL